MSTIRWLGACVGLIVFACGAAWSQPASTGSGQPYPSKSVRVVVVFPPGGATDIVARFVFQKMGEQLNQQFLTDNRVGAAGMIGGEIVAKSPPDGYTIITPIAELYPHLKSGRVRPIAVTSESRTTQFSQLPTIAETVKGYEFTYWFGTFVPAGTPRPIVDKLNAELKKSVADPDLASKLSAQGLDPMHMTPEAFAKHLKFDSDRLKQVVKISGARIE